MFFDPKFAGDKYLDMKNLSQEKAEIVIDSYNK
jgi:hypothetical protein